MNSLPALPDPDGLLTVLTERLRTQLAGRTELGLIGIRTGGVWVAERLRLSLGAPLPLGTIDTAFYRDDYDQKGLHRGVKPSEIPFDVSGRDILLVDDVLYTGRTVRAALDALFDQGRPARVQLLVLIDRGWRELPIEARYVGRMVQTHANEIIEVKFQEIDGMEKVLLVEKMAQGA